MTSATTEKEIKIKISRSDLEKAFNALSRHKNASSLKHKYYPRDYYDTDNLALHKNDIPLRVQYVPGNGKKAGYYKQTLKIPVTDNNLHLPDGVTLRKEFQDVISTSRPDLGKIQNSEAKKAVRPFLRRRLKHIFTAAIERRFFNITVGSGKNKGTVEVAFDIGELILPAFDKRKPLVQIEIELKKGNAAAIGNIKDKIMKMAPSARISPYHSNQDEGTRFINSMRVGSLNVKQ